MLLVPPSDIARLVVPGQASFITIAPPLNWAIIMIDMKRMIRIDVISPAALLP